MCVKLFVFSKGQLDIELSHIYLQREALKLRMGNIWLVFLLLPSKFDLCLQIQYLRWQGTYYANIGAYTIFIIEWGVFKSEKMSEVNEGK